MLRELKNDGVRAWLQLTRLPNVCTAAADVVAAYLYVRADLRPVPVFASLLVTSCCIYLGGTILNDVFDFEKDRRERTQRPLPAGKIQRSTASFAGWTFLIGGVVMAWFVPWLHSDPGIYSSTPWIAMTLAANVWLYDGVLKSTPLGPVAMGACRSLNWCLGLSGGMPGNGMIFWSDYSASEWLIVIGYGMFIAGVTWFARTEARPSARGQLLFGAAWMAAGAAALSLFPFYGRFASSERAVQLKSIWIWPPVLVLLGLPLLRRTMLGIFEPSPLNVQATVRIAITSIIVVNAAICLAVRTPISWSLIILALFVPFIILRRWSDST